LETATEQFPAVVPPADFTKPRLLALVTADWANLTQDGKPNVIGVFDRIFVSKLPHDSPRFFLYARLTLPRSGRLALVIRAPDGSALGEVDVEVHRSSETSEAREPDCLDFVTPLVKLGLPVTGVYQIDAYFDGELLGQAPLIVAERPESETSNAGSEQPKTE
jgi:hypothetical protein